MDSVIYKKWSNKMKPKQNGWYFAEIWKLNIQWKMLLKFNENLVLSSENFTKFGLFMVEFCAVLYKLYI